MKSIDVRLNLPLVAPLVDVMRKAGEGLRGNLAAPLRIDDLDPDFREVWTSELVDEQTQEVSQFLALFDKGFYSDGLVHIQSDFAEGVVRACSALRLELRRSVLSKVTDQQLESGGIQVESFEEPLKTSYLCYVFLATIQELMIECIEGKKSTDADA
jgi:hypothetical protein